MSAASFLRRPSPSFFAGEGPGRILRVVRRSCARAGRRLALLCALPLAAAAQLNLGPVVVSGYGDAYYAYEFGDGSTRERERTPDGTSPLYSFSRNSALAVNEAFLDAKFAGADARAAVGWQVGTYVEQNYTAEGSFVSHLYEATAGLRVAPNVWLDGGVFGSHIGMESSVSKDNWTLTRSLVAENTPYYETGAKLTYDPGRRWLAALLVLDGWQTMAMHAANGAVGTQVQYKPTDALLFNSSTFLGEVGHGPDGATRQRYFHDLYVTDQVTSALAGGLLFDAGVERNWPARRRTSTWLSGAAIAHDQVTPRQAFSLRAEFYDDPDGVIIPTGTPGNFVGVGGSAGWDYLIRPNLMLRLEARTLHATHAIFVRGSRLAADSTYFTTAVAFSF